MTTSAPVPFPSVTSSWVIIDQTTGDVPGLSDFLVKLVDALDEGANRIFSRFHGGTCALRVAANPGDRKPGECAINLRHKQPGDPNGALAWHQVTNGVPDIELPIDTMNGLTGEGDSNALDVCASHELFESLADLGANLLADNLNGKVSAREACDRVEDTFFTASNGLHLSNFLIPAAWIPGASGPYDYLGVLQAQLDGSGAVTMSNGGYDIEASAPSDYSDVTPQGHLAFGKAEHTAPNGTTRIVRAVSKLPISGGRLARKQSPYSRTYRRGVRL